MLGKGLLGKPVSLPNWYRRAAQGEYNYWLDITVTKDIMNWSVPVGQWPHFLEITGRQFQKWTETKGWSIVHKATYALGRWKVLYTFMKHRDVENYVFQGQVTIRLYC